MNHVDYVVEGWILEVSLGGLREAWVARGYKQPDWGFIATPYIAAGGRRVKAYDWFQVPQWALRLVPCIGRVAPTLEARWVVRVVDPEGALKARRGDLPVEVLELLDILSPEWAGLTGSWAIAGEGPRSDVDLVVYGNHQAIRRALADLRGEGLIAPCDVEYRYLKVADKLSRQAYERLSALKTLDSCYKGVPYTIRVLRRTIREPCEGSAARLGVYEGPLRVTDIGESHLTPARYRAELGVGVAILESWHTRYSELPEGSYRGRLELFYTREGLIATPDIVGYLEGPL